MPATPVTHTSAGRAAWGWSGASRTRPSPGAGEGESRGRAFRQPEETQPQEFRHPGAGRASVPHRQAAVRLHQGALPRTGEEHRPGDGADWPGELVCVAQEVDSGIDGPTASAVRKWPTNAPGNRSIRLIEPVTSTVAPKNPISVSPSAATPIDQQFLSASKAIASCRASFRLSTFANASWANRQTGIAAYAAVSAGNIHLPDAHG